MAVCLLNPPLKACSVAINISPKNRVCNRILDVVAQRWEFHNENWFIHALDLLRETIPSVPYCIFCTKNIHGSFRTDDLARTMFITTM